MASRCTARRVRFPHAAVLIAASLCCLATPCLAGLGGPASAPLLAPPGATRGVRDFRRASGEQLAKALREAAVRGDDRQALNAETAVVERKLQPYFAALPKNSAGRLEHATARYALHRYFVREHSIHMRGLEPIGDAWNASSPIASLNARVPIEVQEHFHGHVQVMRGFDLSDLSLLAATLESLVHRDANEWLREAYNLTMHSLHEPVSMVELRSILLTFLWVYLDKPLEGDGPLDYILAQEVPELYPDWESYTEYLNETQDRVFSGSANVTFDEVSELVDVLMDGLGKIQTQVCNSVTDMMLPKAVPGTGRISLSDFYSVDSTLTESPEILKRLGAIDPGSERSSLYSAQVIIPNYVASGANCVTASPHFATCCPDACEGLMTHLELQVAYPTAKPADIVQIVEALPSRTQSAPRKLSDYMLMRLRDIAELHGGRVPLHGRLFAQWMHHAYPFECQFPAAAGHGVFTSAIEWHEKAEETDYDATPEELQEIQERTVKDLEGSDLRSTLPWLGDEAFFAHEQPSLLGEMRTIMRSLAFCGVCFAMVHLAAGAAFGSLGGARKPKKLGDFSF